MALVYVEIVRQEYSENGAVFSAGFVEGDDEDTMYVRLEKFGREPTVILLRPDEMAVIAWCITGVLWSSEIDRLGMVAGNAKEKAVNRSIKA